jgi:hypothetical protein
MNIEDVAHETPEKIHTFSGRSGDRLHAASLAAPSPRRSA